MLNGMQNINKGGDRPMIYDKLYSWQKTIVDKFKDRQSFGLFLDMGL